MRSSLSFKRPSRAQSPSDYHRGAANTDCPSSNAATAKLDDVHLFKGNKVTASLHRRLQEAAQLTPRFLFRAWRECEDPRVVDTVGPVAPRQFLLYDPPIRIFDVPKQTLARGALRHLRGHPGPSLFSDWTHSLHAALEKAQGLTAEASPGTRNTHIAALDTKRLPAHITVFHTSSLGLLDPKIAKVRVAKHKFLAYGVIQGDAYKAVDFEALLRRRSNWLVVPPQKLTKPHIEFELGQGFGAAFGPHFELPITAMLLASYTHNGDVVESSRRLAYLLRKLKDYKGDYELDVPLDWLRDKTIVTDAAIVAGYKDVMRTRLLLRGLVKQRYGQKAINVALGAASVERLTDLLRAENLSDDGDDDDEYSGGDEGEDVDMDEEHSVTGQNYDSDNASGREEVSTDEEQDGSPERLPRGIMGRATKRAVLRATRRTPRFLFRCWNNSDDLPGFLSGGFKGLNTGTAITPLAHLKGTGAKTIFDVRKRDLQAIAEGHLSGVYIDSQFSSWAASLAIAMQHARGKRENCYISIIDTTQFPENVILHVPSMNILSDTSAHRFDIFTHEYLAHGVIQGPGLSCAPLSAIDSALSIVLLSPAASLMVQTSTSHPTRIQKSEVAAARKVGELYGEDFVVPVTLAFLCQKQRSPDFWRSGRIVELPIVVEGLSGCKVPHKLCRDRTILTDIVHTAGFMDVEQMIRLLRALVDWHFGKGARGRSRSRARSLSRPRMYVRARSAGAQREGEKRVRFERGLQDDSDEEVDERGRVRLRVE